MRVKITITFNKNNLKKKRVIIKSKKKYFKNRDLDYDTNNALIKQSVINFKLIGLSFQN